MHNLRFIPRIIHEQDRNINYYVKNNNSDTQYKNKYKKTYSMIMMPFHNGYSLLRNHGPDCVLLPLVDNLYHHFPNRVVYMQHKPLSFAAIFNSPVVEISSLLNFIRISFAKLFSM